MSLSVQLFAGLSHMIIVLLIRSHIYHLFSDYRILRVCLVNLSVGRLNKAILVDTRIACQGVDQSDVGTLGSLDGTHSSVMGIVHVPNLKSGTVSRQTAGTQRRQTSLVGQLTQRIVLIHKLGQLGGTEKFLYGRCHRLDINQGLR